MSRPGGEARAGRVGPNAVIRLMEAVGAMEGAHRIGQVATAAGLERYLAQPPTQMIPAAEAAALNDAVVAAFGARRARTIGWLAGRATADYLLAHRIPRPVQALLRALPAPLAAPLLCLAVRANAWTFAGDGRLEIHGGAPLTLAISGCPLCSGAEHASPACALWAGTFERLFAVLVHSETRVVETACQAAGDAACVFTLDWRPRAALRLREALAA